MSSSSGKLVVPPLHLVNGALQVSPTQLDDIRRCFTYWSYKHVHRREPNQPAPERDCGKAGHAGLEALTKARLADATEADARQAMTNAVTTAFRTIQVPDDEAWRTPIRYNEALLGYCDHWQGDTSYEVVSCETPFTIKLGELEVPWETVLEPRFSELAAREALGTATAEEQAELEKLDTMRDQPHYLPIMLRGIIDRVLRRGNSTIIGDFKFKNDWSSAAQSQYQRDPQFKLYMLALHELQGGQRDLGDPGPVGGAVIDAIVLRAPLSRETARSKPRTEYQRVYFPYTYAQLEETRQHALGWVKMALRQHAEGNFVQNESRCSFFFGKRCCPFLDVCSVPVEQRAMVLDSDYFKDKVDYLPALNVEKEVADAIE